MIEYQMLWKLTQVVKALAAPAPATLENISKPLIDAEFLELEAIFADQMASVTEGQIDQDLESELNADPAETQSNPVDPNGSASENSEVVNEPSPNTEQN